MMLRTPAGKRPRPDPLPSEPQELPEASDAGAWELAAPGNELWGVPELDGELCSLQDGFHDPDFLGWSETSCTYKCRNMVKSEFLETLNLREKQVLDYEHIIRSLREKLEAADLEKKILVEQSNSLHQSLASVTAKEAALRKQRTEEYQQAEQRLRNQLTRCHELQEQLQLEMSKGAEAESKAREAESKILACQRERDELQEDSAVRIARLQRECQEINDDNTSEISRVRAEFMIEKGRADSALSEANTLHKQCETLQELLNECLNEKQELESKLASISMSTSVSSENNGDDIIIKHLREELERGAEEIQEANRLKHYHSNLNVLREQLETERRRAERAEQALGKSTELQVNFESLENEIQAWKAMMKEIPGVDTRDDILQKFKELQRETMGAHARIGELSAKLEELQSLLEKSELQKGEAAAAAAAAKAATADAEDHVHRLERQISLLAKERDGLKAVIASYDMEESMLLHAKTLADGSEVPCTPEKSKLKHIEELELSLTESQQTLRNTEMELETKFGLLKEQRNNTERLELELKKAEAKIVSLDREGSQLRHEIGILEKKLGCGEFNPSTTRVLRLRQTPGHDSSNEFKVQTSQSQIGSDKYENEIANLTKKVAVLEQESATLKKRESRLVQVFADKAMTFRKACSLIFGFEILMDEKPDMPVTIITLKSIYSKESRHEVLEFQYTLDNNAKERIDLLANDYTSTPEIARQVATFLRGFKSVPAFVANLTLELFNRTTIS